jgi:hypothetical protein
VVGVHPAGQPTAQGLGLMAAACDWPAEGVADRDAVDPQPAGWLNRPAARRAVRQRQVDRLSSTAVSRREEQPH